MSVQQDNYYIPHSAHWPIIGSIGLFLMFIGGANWLHLVWHGPHIFLVGLLILVFMMFGWFHEVIRENQRGMYNEQVDRTFRWGMVWFIFSEVCFFGVFFGVLFYSRYWVVPLLGGEVYPITHILLWPDFTAHWPLLNNPDNQLFIGAHEVMPAWGIPALNTLILLSSGATLTWAHWALKLSKRKQLVISMMVTILLGLVFLLLQIDEYHDAYTEFNLTLSSGIYGTTFFILTGFHGAHVTVGTIMLIVILLRCMKGHFTHDNHFAFEAVAWYWHFVDVVWLFLFVFVYWL